MGTIELKNVTKSFGPVAVIKGVSLTAEEGEFVVFVGPSGCGKSTLLRLIAGLEETSGGSIHIDGKDVTELDPYHRGLSMVFQSYALYPHMTVYGNIAFALKTAGIAKLEIDRKVRAAAETLKLTPYLDRKPKDLSGGQRQRVAIGRAIVRQPKGFLFDEPLSNLDAALRTQTRIEIANLHKELGATMVYVTHDQIEAMTLADKIVVLNDGEVMQIGSPKELYNAPKNTFVAQFIGSPKMNLLPRASYDGAAMHYGDGVKIDIGPMDGTPSIVGVRPEDISLCPLGEAELSATVTHNEFHGADNNVFVSVPGIGSLNVRANGKLDLQSDQPVGLVLDKSQLHYFDENGVRI
ncbi:ABC transporter ATP-binding protein [Parasedimentitalea psychrophila]|uniref:ABC transporter ATP-binding protein n=1 Tax=Parasedimentitalea psychrophila TaxID=2997337 RepID=A0A9Y2KXP8_9RHOB|nr:ABC transporter ATP-binding protein [Parasedimentitalea psychrophila]WIY24583.1 ABC transporter ATP-binding protein [Parasedimentitalea psychrophila]